jgi:hypothetical protein
VSIKKSVPNLIFYLHDFFRNFSQFLAIFFELFSSRVIYLNSKFDSRVGPACQWQCRAAPSRDWLPRAALSGRARGGLNVVPIAPRPPPRQPRAARPHASPLAPPPRQCSPLASPLALPSRPPWSEAVVAWYVVVPPRRSPVAAVPVPVSRPVPRPSPVRRWAPPFGRRAVSPPCSAAAAHCADRSSWAARAAPADAKPGRPRVAVGHVPAWPRAEPALCDYAERGFTPVALGLDFIFSEYIQFFANSKICVGFI